MSNRVAPILLAVLLPVVAEENFDLLVQDMDRNYSHFDTAPVDWTALVEKHRPRAEASKTTEEFLVVAREMLAELKDIHVWIQTADGKTVGTWVSSPTPNYDYKAVGRRLKDLNQIGKIAFAGRTEEGFGVLAVGSLQGADELFKRIDEALAGMMDAPGLIVDLRANMGGDERRAQHLAGRFTDKPLQYAKSRFRNGPGHGDFGEEHERVLQPRGGEAYTKPIVCLVGPVCMSSGEGFAKMMKALPHAVLVGQPTRGASGNPQPVELPNGLKVFYSRWQDLLPDGTPLEGKGLQPDVLVEHAGEGDPTFEAGVRELAKRVAK